MTKIYVRCVRGSVRFEQWMVYEVVDLSTNFFLVRLPSGKIAAGFQERFTRVSEREYKVCLQERNKVQDPPKSGRLMV